MGENAESSPAPSGVSHRPSRSPSQATERRQAEPGSGASPVSRPNGAARSSSKAPTWGRCGGWSRGNELRWRRSGQRRGSGRRSRRRGGWRGSV